MQLAANLIEKTQHSQAFLQDCDMNRRVYSIEADDGTPSLVHFVDFADLDLLHWSKFTSNYLGTIQKLNENETRLTFTQLDEPDYFFQHYSLNGIPFTSDRSMFVKVYPVLSSPSSLTLLTSSAEQNPILSQRYALLQKGHITATLELTYWRFEQLE